MNPEDVPAELVDLGYAAMLDAGYRVVEDIGDQVPEDQAVRKVLAAVMPDIQARALEDAALELNLPGSTATGYYASEQVAGYNDADRDAEEWLIERAARLTDTSEGPTT